MKFEDISLMRYVPISFLVHHFPHHCICSITRKENMLASLELNHWWLQMQLSPAMVASHPLDVQHHLEMIRDNLWAINSLTAMTRFKLLYDDGYLLGLKEEEVEWLRDVDVATADMKNLLNRILDSKKTIVDSSGRHLHCPFFSSIRLAHHRRLILVELNEMLLNLNYLMLRGSRLGLQRESMDSMDPLEDEYMTILKSEVVGRDEDIDKIIAILQQPSFNNHNDDDHDGDNDDSHDDGAAAAMDDDDDDSGGATIDDENDSPLVIVIKGTKMVGKTTLARMIYHHNWVCQYFHHRIWVDMDLNSSLNLNNMIVREFQRSIIKMGVASECVCKLKLDLPLQAVWQFVDEQLGGSKYFLVLDCKVFPNIKKHEWDGLKHILLRVGGQGSAILITHRTNTEFDTDMLHGMRFIETYNLDGLSEDAWVKLFLRHHDASGNPSDQHKLSLEHAKQLFKHCNGLPVWAKYTESFRYDVDWINFEFENDNDPSDTFSLVRLRAFQYLSLFLNKPNPEVILHMLIADGTILDFIGAIDEISYEISQKKWLYKGDEFHLVEIIDKISEEFWLRKWQLEEGKVDPNEMEAIVGMQYLQIRVGNDSRIKIPRQCRHLCLVLDSKARAFRLPTLPVEVISKLRTLILQVDETVTPIAKVQRRLEEAAMRATKMLARLVHLQTLYLETNTIRQLPIEVSKLVNLRNLHISKNKMESLPESLCSLTNLLILSLVHCQKLQMLPDRIHKFHKLQILELVHCTKLCKLPKLVTRLKNLQELNVEGCCWLMELPEDLSNMQTLRVLNVVGCASLSLLPHGIQKMVNLRKLTGICIENGISGGSFRLKELQALTNLKEIRLRNLERVSKQDEETQIESLWMIQRLEYVSLHWVNDMSICKPTTSLQLLEAFEFNTHLKSIEIISYMGMEFPSWMSKEISYVNSLVEVRLINLKKCSRLPPLGQIGNLKKIEISGMDSIKEVDDACIGVNLEELTFSEMPALEQLSIASYYCDRKLRELTLIQCPKLNSLNSDIWVFYHKKVNLWLNIEQCWSHNFSGWKYLKFIREMEIVGCEELRHLPRGMQNLSRLEQLKIMSCNNLVALPNFDSLSYLHIYACPKLSYIPQRIKTHLQVLKIEGCPRIEMEGATS